MADEQPKQTPAPESEMTKLLKSLPELQETQPTVEPVADSLLKSPVADPVQDLDDKIAAGKKALEKARNKSVNKQQKISQFSQGNDEPIFYDTVEEAKKDNASPIELELAAKHERENNINSKATKKAAEFLKNKTNLEYFMANANLDNSDLDIATFRLVAFKYAELALKYLPRYHNKTWANEILRIAALERPLDKTNQLVRDYRDKYKNESWWNEEWNTTFEELSNL